MKRKLLYFYLPKNKLLRCAEVGQSPNSHRPPPLHRQFLCFCVIDCKITYVPLKNSISSYLPALTKSERLEENVFDQVKRSPDVAGEAGDTSETVCSLSRCHTFVCYKTVLRASFHNWFDDRAWYPLGRIIGGTIYPGLMVTSAVLYHIMQFINITIDIRNVCVFLAPFFSSLTTIITYLLTKELKDSGSGLVAAAMISIVPGYISRSVAGSYDNEAIAIFCMLLTYYMWIKSVKTGSILWSALAAVAYFYMVSSWGGYVFLINLIPMHVLTLMITGRFSHRIYVAYSILYCLGTMLSMQISFVGFQPVQSSEHMLALGVFGLCQLHGLVDYLRSKLTPTDFEILFRAVAVGTATVTVIIGTILTVTGKIAPWTGRFYTLLDPSYAKNHIPIIASVSEHQPTSWSSFYFDLQILVFLFPAGLYFCFAHLTDANIFLILYGVTSIYFAGVMVRLMLVLAPVMCILSGIAVSSMLHTYMKQVDPDKNVEKKKNKLESNFVMKSEVS
ncbi:hypothetical protein GE061_018024 [Apolygus lucorum]|uniref:Dolichyl-diphosphooligosaccharide--protein glycosyltransferase subunit STT3A n=1 Tax=Apolygus lucorum TaxID=248454 RepID=A0A8S9XET3_APOLU|nr:hypothetical protein GE061_018024 [Apolygus lucorum]